MLFAPIMSALGLSQLRRAVSSGVVAACAWMSGAALAGDAPQRPPSPTVQERAWRELPPEQRREMWQSLSPEQRELLMRRVPHDERRRLWQQMTPEQRDAMRQRFTERREQGGAEGRTRLTPEERQRLREQIRESQRDWKKKPAPEGQREQR